MNALNKHKSHQHHSRVVSYHGRGVYEVDYRDQEASSSGGVSTILRVPEVIGNRYRVVDFLSKGGQGAVFVAHDISLMNRQVLIKVSLIKNKSVRAGLEEGDWEPLQEENSALKDEARQLIEIRNRGESRAPCLVRLVKDVCADVLARPEARAFDQADYEITYLVMQYLPGTTLASMIKKVAAGQHPHYRLDQKAWWRLCLNWTRQLSSILGHLHKLNHEGIGYAYCDLKPENCIVSHRDISLIDFGALKELYQEGSAEGGVLTTQGYCAPESYDEAYSGDLDGRIDVYSVGAVLWAMLSGQRPSSNKLCLYGNRSPDLLAIPNALPKQLPDCVHELLKRCLSPDREDRPDAAELKHLCREALLKL